MIKTKGGGGANEAAADWSPGKQGMKSHPWGISITYKQSCFESKGEVDDTTLSYGADLRR